MAMTLEDYRKERTKNEGYLVVELPPTDKATRD
jgi:hypothetical protein